MKRLCLLLLLFPSVFFAQMKLDTVAKTVSFSKVYDVKYSKEQIRQKAREWIAINFKDANEVVKLDTEDKIISKGYFDISYTSSGYPITSKIYFILEIDFKPSRYKIDMNTLEMSLEGVKYPMDTHFFVSDYYSNYVKTIEKLRDDATENFYIKFYTKLLLNDKKMNELFTQQKALSSAVKVEITNEVENIAESLYNYVSSKTKEEW